MAHAIPYFNWAAPVTNAGVRRALADGTDDDTLFWMARILREARYRTFGITQVFDVSATVT
ncbi:MAG TPA: hypothetical protein VM925_07890 [Labilithrix sp.]|nr:hypothetical protein [Labilithrix sp.]